MKLTERVLQKLDDDPISLTAWSLLAILAVATVASRLEWWNSRLTAVLAFGLRLQNDVGEPRFWLLYILDVFLFGLPVIVLLLIRSEINRRRALKAKSETSAMTHRAIRGMMRAATKLRHGSFPDNPGHAKCTVSIEIVFLIERDFTTRVTRKQELKAASTPLRFLEIDIGVTSCAEPAEYLEDINFRVQTNDEHEVVYLPVENDRFRKKVVLYFLPRIEINEPRPRSFTLSYRWRKMLAQLSTEGDEAFTWRFGSAEPIGSVKISFFLQPGTGRNLDCKLTGPHYEGATIEKANNDGWPGFVYQVHNAPPGRDHAISLILREP